jgi:hypothetical protein
MANAVRDENRVHTVLGVSSVDSETPVPIQANPTTGAQFVETTATLAGTPIVGQAAIAETGTAVQLGDNDLTQGVTISALSTNAAVISVGASTVNNTVDGSGNGFILEKGEKVFIQVANTNDLYVNGTANDVVSFVGV